MKVAVAGAAGALGTLVLRRLAADRAIREVYAIDARAPLVASRKIRHVSDEPPPVCDASVWLAGRVGPRAPRIVSCAPSPDPGADAVWLRPARLVGARRGPGLWPWRRLVWDEDVADAILLAVHFTGDARGAFALDAAAGSTAEARLGWRPRCRSGAEVRARFAAEASGRRDPRLALFFAVVARAAPRVRLPEEARHLAARVHLAVTGPGGGDWTLRLDGGRLAVRSGAPRPPTVTLTLAARTLRELLAGRSDFASAQLAGRIRVEGEALGAMVLQSLIANFRTTAARRGLPGRVAGRLSRWLGVERSRA
jgi:hypothetical protein